MHNTTRPIETILLLNISSSSAFIETSSLFFQTSHSNTSFYNKTESFVTRPQTSLDHARLTNRVNIPDNTIHHPPIHSLHRYTEHELFMIKLHEFERHEATWSDWFWKPLLTSVIIIMVLSFAYLLYWQSEINRGRYVAYHQPRYHTGR
jgi:hypothetical protein